jgi:hypothetical protein
MLDTITVDSPIRGLADELQRQLGTKKDLMADTRRVSFTETDAEWLHGEGPARDEDDVRRSPRGLDLLVDMPDGARAFKVTGHAHDQIGQHLGINSKLYDRLLANHPDLLANLANGLLSREPSTRMLRTLDGRVRAFLSNRYRPRDNWDLLDGAILPALAEFPGVAEFKRCDLTETRMYVKVVIPGLEKQVTPKVGDVIRGGVIIQNSEVGAGALVIAPYTDVLRCTNGMVHTDFGQRTRHVGKRIVEDEQEAWELYSDETLALDDAAFFAKCGDTLRSALNETVFDRIVEQMRDLAQIRFEGPPDTVVEVFASRHTLTENERGSMLTALIEEGDLTAWGYVNALTRTARDLESPDRQTELETLAGRLVSDPSSFQLAQAA